MDCNLVQMDKYFVHVQLIRILMGVKGHNVFDTSYLFECNLDKHRIPRKVK